MQTFFNTEELNFIQSREWFEMKTKCMDKTSYFLGSLNEAIHQRNDFVFLRNKENFKITKGENLLGFPYFVLDTPKLSTENAIFSVRVILWWGNYISTNLLLGEAVFQQYRVNIIRNINSKSPQNIWVSIANNHWKHELENELNYFIR